MSTINDEKSVATAPQAPEAPADPHQMHNSIIRQLVAAVEQLKGFNTAYDALIVEANTLVGTASA